MKLKQYQINAFIKKLFGGNPRCGCSFACMTGCALLQAIAAENNLSETAFFVPLCPKFSAQ